MIRTLFSAAVLAIAVRSLSAAEIRKQSGDLVVTVAEADGGAGKPRVLFERAGSGQTATVDLNNHTESVSDILFTAPDQFVVRGKLRNGSRDDVLTVISTRWNMISDTVWARDLVVSPDGRTAGYQFRSPDSMGRTVLLTALVAYDLTAPAEPNRARSARNEDPSERGIPVYPEENRVRERYWILVEQGGTMTGGAPRRSFVSPIAWSPDSKRLAVVEHEGEEARLVIVDVSKGLRHASAMLVPIDREAFLQPNPGNALPIDLADSFVTFRDLHFSENGGSVSLTSWQLGPFAEKTVGLAVPSVNR